MNFHPQSSALKNHIAKKTAIPIVDGGGFRGFGSKVPIFPFGTHIFFGGKKMRSRQRWVRIISKTHNWKSKHGVYNTTMISVYKWRSKSRWQTIVVFHSTPWNLNVEMFPNLDIIHDLVPIGMSQLGINPPCLTSCNQGLLNLSFCEFSVTFSNLNCSC